MLTHYLAIALAFVVALIGAVFYGRQKGVKSANLQNEATTKTEEVNESRKQEKLKNDVIQANRETRESINSLPDGGSASELQREYSRD